MTRVTITDEVVAQLRDVLEAGVLDDEHNYVGARFAAIDLGHDELAAFVDAADAATYHEALKRARAVDDVRREDDGDEKGDGESDDGDRDGDADEGEGDADEREGDSYNRERDAGDRADGDQTSSTS